MDFRLPELGEGVYEAELVSWLVQPGASVKRGQGLLEVLTDKATMEVPAPFAGTIEALKVEPGQPGKVGDVLLTYAPIRRPTPERRAAAAENARPAPASREAVRRDSNGPARGDLPVKAAPSVRSMARKLGIDLARVHGSGPEGRILIDDLTSVF